MSIVSWDQYVGVYMPTYDIAPSPKIRHILLGARGQAAPQAGEVLSRDHMFDVH